MKNLLKLDLKTILIIVLVISLFLMKMCSNGVSDTPLDTVRIDNKKYEVIKYDIDTQYVPVTKVVSKPGKNIYHDTTIYVSLPISIDTMDIIKDYHAKNIYKDTLKLDDSLGFITVIDTIQKNNILNRIWSSKVNKITVKETLIVKEPARNQLYLGFNTTINKSDIFGTLGVEGSLKNKRYMLYNLGLGVEKSLNGVVPYIGIGIQWKIKIKKN